MNSLPNTQPLPTSQQIVINNNNSIDINVVGDEGWEMVRVKRRAGSPRTASLSVREQKTELRPTISEATPSPVTRTWRITDIDMSTWHSEIRQRGLSSAPCSRFHNAPFGPDSQTVVVEFSEEASWASSFPPQRSADTVYEMTDDDISDMFDAQAWRCTLTPKVDNHFAGLTPLGAPAYDMATFDEAIRCDYNRFASKWASVLMSLAEKGSGYLHRIQFDIIILTPQGQHPFDFWMNEKDMWVADYLVNEGFDAARISIYGGGGHARPDRLKNFTDELESLKNRVNNDPKHSIILVDFHTSLNDSLALEAYRHYDANSQKLTSLGGLGLLLLSNSQPVVKISPQQRMKFRSLPNQFVGQDVSKPFPGDDQGAYRKVVKEIWDLERLLFIGESQQPSLRHSRLKDNLTTAIPVFEQLIDGIRRSQALNPPNRKNNNLEHNPEFFGLRWNVDFRSWLEPESKCHNLRIVGGTRWMLRDFCGWLCEEVMLEDSSHYNVVHVDCKALVGTYGRYTESWNGSILSGPLLLGIFRLLVNQQPPASINSAIVELIGRIEDRSGIMISDSAESTEGPFELLVQAIEILGSNLADIITDVLKRQPGSATSKSMIIVSGIHEFRKGLELGHFVHTIRKLQGPKSAGQCKILFTHEKRPDLEVLLSDVTCINDLEYKECLDSLNNEQLSTLRPIEQRHEATLSWIWQDNQYRGWKDDKDSALLLILGKPACGKSVLSKFINNAAEPHDSPRGENPRQNTVTSFYFRGSSSLSGRHTMLQAILHGVLSESPLFFPYFQEEYRKLGIEPDKPFITWPQEALEAVVEKVKGHPRPHTVFIIVDGLDESTEPLTCAKLLGSLCLKGDHGFRTKLLLAMRRHQPTEDEVTEALVQGSNVYTLTLQERNRGDIEEYARAFLNASVAKRVGWHSDVVDSCVKTLATKSQGIFLWAKLTKSLIQDYCKAHRASSLEDFEEFLGGIPKDIEDLYSRLFDDLVKRLKERKGANELAKLRRMLQIVAEAKRELLLKEFEDAWILPPLGDDKEFVLGRRRSTNIRGLVSYYTANFLEVHESNGSVGLLHPTAEEFLRNREDPAGGGPLLGMEDPLQTSTMGGACIKYLMYAIDRFPESQPGESQPNMDNFTNDINDLPFLEYVVEHGGDHITKEQQQAVACFGRLRDKMSKSALRGLLGDWMSRQTQRLGIRNWASYIPGPITFWRIPEKDKVLHWAASKGQTTTAKVALKAGANPKSKSDQNFHKTREDALCLAIMSRNDPQAHGEEASKAIAQVLLDHGADVDGATLIGGTPLHYAGKFMNTSVLDLLLRKGADVNAKDSRSMTPLHRAVIGVIVGAEESEPEIPNTDREVKRDASLDCVRKLVEAGARLDVGDDRGQKPIHWASGLEDREKILEYLIKASGQEHRKKRSAGNQKGKSPQQDEARAANEKCEGRSSTPVFWASRYNCIESLKILIRKGASIDQVNNAQETAPSLAARWGCDAALEMLISELKRLGSVAVKRLLNQQECSGRTALIWASRNGNLSCVKFLISAGADVNLCEEIGYEWATPLSWAVSRGHLEIVQYLLSKHASIPNASNRPLVSLGACSGNTKVIDELYKKAGETHLYLSLEQHDRLERTAFLAAASGGHIEMAKYLRYWDANIHHEDKEKNTALLLAAGWGHLEMVKWLLQVGLDINHANSLGETALDRAVLWKRKQVADFLHDAKATTGHRNERRRRKGVMGRARHY